MSQADYDKVAGKAKEAAGKVTGDKDTEAEGKVQNAEGKIKDAAEDAKASAKAAFDRIKHAGHHDDHDG